jgi:mono/diheme cytochrome c family protein
MRRLMPSSRKIATLSLAAALAVGMSACGQHEISLSKADNQDPHVKNGAQLFYERCSGCHSLNAANAFGSRSPNFKKNSERTNGPDFNQRAEPMDDVLFAIRNGGFSGAIMPANVVTGQDAQDVAAFVHKYAGQGK